MSRKFLLAYKWLCITVFALIALGSSVRAMNAGLACPDWPLCFGKYIPDYHPQVYFEFIHRVIAGFVGIVTLVLNGKLVINSNVPKNIRILAVFAIALLFSQALLGGLTVLLLLKSSIVTLHLLFGLSFLSCLLWIYFSLSKKSISENSPWIRYASALVLVISVSQILLGGMVASNYAGLACTDFPLCNGKLLPTIEGAVGLQALHRLGAYTTFLSVVILYFALRKFQNKISKLSRLLVSLVLIQVALGIANIKFLLPALITVLHTAVAAAIVGTCVYIVYLAWTSDSQNRVGFQAQL